VTTYLTETKPQIWRAVAVFDDDREALLYLGASSQQVRAGYLRAFNDVLDEEEREMTKAISLQRWNGAPDAGKWSQQCELILPTRRKLARSA
jgi:hypothetical protein